ncbi:MAG: aminoacyl-tRNA hydrolase [Dehalococcoidales bacterium]|nr:aminoacyl-tRNA hydrolase [Dehalococcoidales bacterium]
MKLIVGLGNPGREYASTRHNAGFACLNYFAKMQNIRFDKKQCKARTGSGMIAGSEVILARPQTYMNRSGESVGLLVNKFDINLDDLIVIHDELDLPLGKIRIRSGSSSGGHKGADSIINALDSRNFTRIRVGIGRPDNNNSLTVFDEDEIIHYVLSDFTFDEKQIVTEVISRISEAIIYLLTEGLTTAMNKYN